MEMSIAFDSHKRYPLAFVEDEQGRMIDECRIDHQRGAIRAYLEPFPDGTPVAVETIGNWYWIVDETQQRTDAPRGLRPDPGGEVAHDAAPGWVLSLRW